MGEGKKGTFQLREVHRLLTQRKGNEAQMLLAQLSGEPLVNRNELTYLQAWLAVAQEDWENIALLLRDAPALLPQEEQDSLLTNGSVRRRRPMCLLILGEMARELEYPEEAIEHIQHSLTLLNERRMNIPEVRLLAHCSLGRLALDMNQTAQALTQYETALHLYNDQETGSALRTAVLTGLCDTQMRLEQFEQALDTGKRALASLEADDEEHLLVLLSHICLAMGDSASALVYAQDAKNAANQSKDVMRVAHTLLVLAEIQQKECFDAQDARANCEQALALLAQTPEQPLNGTALFLLGKIAECEWSRSREKIPAANEAQARYEQARAFFTEQHDTASLAKVSRQLAQLLEERGEPEQALIYWKQAFMLTEQYN
ncbi:MAG TPA: hypothetical protein VGD98_06425 [Ktedonobacteraceae bacterium]